MYANYRKYLQSFLSGMKEVKPCLVEDLKKSDKYEEPVIQQKEGIDFTSDNYFGVDEMFMEEVRKSVESHSYGDNVDIQQMLEYKISRFFKTENTLLLPPGFNASKDIYDTLFTNEDAIFYDNRNSSPICTAISNCRAEKYSYESCDMTDFNNQILKSQEHRFNIVVTDGVFPIDGNTASLREIVSKTFYSDAMVMVDETYSMGVVGEHGWGVTELHGVLGDVEIITGRLGRAFRGDNGGFITGRWEIIEYLRQKIDDNRYPVRIPVSVAISEMKMLDKLTVSNDVQDCVHSNVEYFISRMVNLGFNISHTRSAICSIVLEDEMASKVIRRMEEEHIYATLFSYPDVPKGKSRIRFRIASWHTREHLNKTIDVLSRL
ncbi:MAG: aminotransferase class I/II-fold pyridoxal phosphate-dependent enzyme [Bacteroidales bacterium]|nr:aminotransferase class I/II-fold pyridoxal phosphate-dependent enzyme [Bacteroidales bacterium]